MGEIHQGVKIEQEKTLDYSPQKSEISREAANALLEKRLAASESEQNSEQNDIINPSEPVSPNSKYFKDGHIYETDDNGKVYKIDDELLPNSEYESNGYKYKTDDRGRVVNVSGNIKLEPGQRDLNAQAKAGGDDRRQGDQGGHLIADRFGGSGGSENLVPMRSELNQGDYKKMENDLAKAVSEGKQVTVSVDVKYDADSKRPSSIAVSYTIDGETFKKTFTN